MPIMALSLASRYDGGSKTKASSLILNGAFTV